ncbi:MAG: hypothetical protein KDB71_16750 [Mycobacterium sp.]|nr:hypothetical protein [Mycobacterium sp.]
MQRKRNSLVLLVAGAGVAAALGAAPLAAAQPQDPQLPSCEETGGSSVLGGQTTDCASPGNIQIDATPEFIPGDDYGGFYGFPGYF